jgi:succinate dehydrogenase / fumarate reductase cytochrome b subunit
MAEVNRAGVQEFTTYEVHLIGRFVRSSVGRKVVMAVSGCGLFAFVFVHMMGNLQIFWGPEPVNHYAHFLKSNAEIIWPARYGLIACVLVHIVTGLSLWIENHRARVQQYAVRKLVGASWASRTMLVTGSLFIAYIIFHLLHLTIGSVQPELLQYRDHEGRHDVYRMMVVALANPWTAVWYVLGTGTVCFHLSHGASAMFQSLGWKNPAYAERMTTLAQIGALVMFLGYAAVPMAIVYGVIR